MQAMFLLKHTSMNRWLYMFNPLQCPVCPSWQTWALPHTALLLQVWLEVWLHTKPLSVWGVVELYYNYLCFPLPLLPLWCQIRVEAPLHMGHIDTGEWSCRVRGLYTALPHTPPFHLLKARWVLSLTSPMSLADFRGGVKVEHLWAPGGTSLFILLDGV